MQEVEEPAENNEANFNFAAGIAAAIILQGVITLV